MDKSLRVVLVVARPSNVMGIITYDVFRGVDRLLGVLLISIASIYGPRPAVRTV